MSYQRALDLYCDLGDRYGEATTTSRLADSHHAVGDLDAARSTWRLALAILDELGHTDADHIRMKLATLDSPH